MLTRKNMFKNCLGWSTWFAHHGRYRVGCSYWCLRLGLFANKQRVGVFNQKKEREPRILVYSTWWFRDPKNHSDCPIWHIPIYEPSLLGSVGSHHPFWWWRFGDVKWNHCWYDLKSLVILRFPTSFLATKKTSQRRCLVPAGNVAILNLSVCNFPMDL